ncbi:MAG: hypothetical protein KGL39_55920, partial [Patescibacteria group bacterium]|nr:hypothetical protein [Patescibacteria group bacterium]
MARPRRQAPKLRRSKTKDGKSDRWWFRAYVDIRDSSGNVKHTDKAIHVGYCSEMGKREAQSIMDEKVAKINRPDEVISSQIFFGEILDRWIKMCEEDGL